MEDLSPTYNEDDSTRIEDTLQSIQQNDMTDDSFCNQLIPVANDKIGTIQQTSAE